MKAFLAMLVQKRFAKIAAGGLAAVLAAIGGVTTVGFLQGAVERSADYAATAAEFYCNFPQVDRERFRSEVLERLVARAQETGAGAIDVRVTCPVSSER